MQQYFSDTPLVVGQEYIFTKDQAHHARNVVRLHHEKIRLVYDGIGYFADAYSKGKDFVAMVLEKDERIKFELVLQKACELGVTRIVPFESMRCVVRAKKEKEDKQQARRIDILQEAAEQCKRNRIPEITPIVQLKDLVKYRSDINVLPYENAYSNSKFMTEVLSPGKSITFVIGPEGGFAPEEVEFLKQNGYETITLGRRILRAETAAMYACAVISEFNEAHDNRL